MYEWINKRARQRRHKSEHCCRESAPILGPAQETGLGLSLGLGALLSPIGGFSRRFYFVACQAKELTVIEFPKTDIAESLTFDEWRDVIHIPSRL